MDNSGGGKRLGKPKPFMKFPAPKPANRFEPFTGMSFQDLTVSDDLQPGTLPNQPILGQFNPYGPRIVNTSNANVNSLSFQPSAGTTSPDFVSPDSSNMSTSSSSTSLSTREHFIRTYSQESVGKLKIEPNTEVSFFLVLVTN